MKAAPVRPAALDGQPGGTAVGSVACACRWKQLAKVAVSLETTRGGVPATESWWLSCGTACVADPAAWLASAVNRATPVTATPIAWPHRSDALSTPPAEPTSCQGTAARAKPVLGAMMKPVPMPATSID